MTADRQRQHARYDELTAGYALDALDPPDEADFAGHLPGCDRCQDAVARFTEITAALAQAVPAAEPSPALGARIMAAVALEPVPGAPGRSYAPAPSLRLPDEPVPAGPEFPYEQVPAGPGFPDERAAAGRSLPAEPAAADFGLLAEPPAGPARPAGPPRRAAGPAWAGPGRANPAHRRPTRLHPGQPRQRRPLRVIAAGVATAAALIAGGLTWAGIQGGGSTPQPPAASCLQAGTCRQIVLTSAVSHAPAARVIVADGTAWLVPAGLKADNTTQQVYVLWQITGGHTPLAVGSFDVRLHGTRPIRIGALAVPYSRTWAFAVSLEHGRTIPATPSRPVALGQTPS
jgi:anti-sigma-K factor RskA